MANEVLTQIKLRKNFYRDNYRRIANIMLFTMMFVLLLVAAMVYKVLTRVEPFYYATAMNGALTKLSPLTSPNMSSEPLI